MVSFVNIVLSLSHCGKILIIYKSKMSLPLLDFINSLM